MYLSKKSSRSAHGQNKITFSLLKDLAPSTKDTLASLNQTFQILGREIMCNQTIGEHIGMVKNKLNKSIRLLYILGAKSCKMNVSFERFMSSQLNFPRRRDLYCSHAQNLLKCLHWSVLLKTTSPTPTKSQDVAHRNFKPVLSKSSRLINVHLLQTFKSLQTLLLTSIWELLTF